MYPLRMVSAIAVAVVTLAACTTALDDREYGVDAARGFEPDISGLDLGSAWEYSASDVWDSNPHASSQEAEPDACVTLIAAFDVQGPDDSQATGSDPVFYHQGSASWAPYISLDYRVFPTPADARAFRDAAVEVARSCAGGYQAGVRGMFLHTESIEAGEATLPGGYATTVVTESSVTAGLWDEPGTNEFYEVGRHYFYVQGNIVFVATFMLPADRDVSDMAGDLVAAFSVHLG